MPPSASSPARAERGLQLCSEVALWDKLMLRRVRGALFGLAIWCSGAAAPAYFDTLPALQLGCRGVHAVLLARHCYKNTILAGISQRHCHPFFPDPVLCAHRFHTAATPATSTCPIAVVQCGAGTHVQCSGCRCNQ